MAERSVHPGVDAGAVEGPRPRGHMALLIWGPIAMSNAGWWRVGTASYPSGALVGDTTGWRETTRASQAMHRSAVAAGA
jgi:hypothetical protein